MAELYESYNDVYSILPVKLYKHDLHGTFIYAPLHWHRSLEITIPLTGRISFNTGSNSFDFGESDWLFVNSCELHSCRYITREDHFTGISIIVSLPFIEKWLGKNLFFYNPEKPEVTKKIKAIARELYELDSNVAEYNLLVMGKLYDVLYVVASNCVKRGEGYAASLEKDVSLATTFTDYIEAHYSDELSLADVAENFKYSPSYFSRLFKDSLGVNFHAYLNFVRVSHAAEQLSNGHDNLTECAYNNGFPNMKSFITTFKKLYGCTPGSFLASQKR
ncbi:MAG: helix-turn-helix transcriptional regulator [Lachnospiraceae bacterium]|nr:helix-turn-helix transcriptional regulator [Lachnospiraceae bacterium]